MNLQPDELTGGLYPFPTHIQSTLQPPAPLRSSEALGTAGEEELLMCWGAEGAVEPFVCWFCNV